MFTLPDVAMNARVARLEALVSVLLAFTARIGELVPGIDDDPLVGLCLDVVEGKPGAAERFDEWVTQRKAEIAARGQSDKPTREP